MATAKKHIAKNGKITYYLRAYNGYDRFGKQIEHRMTWTPKPGMSEKAIQKELERQKVLFEEKIRSHSLFDSDTTFEEYSLRWLDNNRPPQLAPKTYTRYASMLNIINIAIGGIKLIDLQSQHLQAFYNNLREEGVNNKDNYALSLGFKELLDKAPVTKSEIALKAGIAQTTMRTVSKKDARTKISTARAIAAALNVPVEKLFKIHYSKQSFSDKTILNHHRLISCILRQATMDRIIPYNIATRDYIKAPKVTRKEATFLNDKEAELVLTALKNEPIKWRTAMELLIYSGMRRGELMGLEWKDVDFENKVIHIYRTSQYIPDLGIITKDTKNVTSERTIRLPDAAFETLREYRNHWLYMRMVMGDLWQDKITITHIDGKKEVVDNDRLFIKDDSTPMHPDSITAWTGDFIKKYNLPKFSPHSLRHTNASLLIANGVNIPTVSKRLGHANVTTTTKIYSHAIQSADEKAADILASKLNPLKNG